MKKNLTELVFILDKSGSMSGLEKDTVGGFNIMLAAVLHFWMRLAKLLSI